MKNNIVREKSMSLSINSIVVYKELVCKNEFVISKQFLKSATSIGANIHEAIFSLSKKDFLNKMYISYKEAYETLYWIKLIKYMYASVNVDVVNSQTTEVIKILTSIIKTTKKGLNNIVQ